MKNFIWDYLLRSEMKAEGGPACAHGGSFLTLQQPRHRVPAHSREAILRAPGTAVSGPHWGTAPLYGNACTGWHRVTELPEATLGSRPAVQVRWLGEGAPQPTAEPKAVTISEQPTRELAHSAPE